MSSSLRSLPSPNPLPPLCFKCRFYDYSGMVRPTDQKTTATKKIVWSLKFAKVEGMPCHAGPHRVSQETEGSKEKMWAGAFAGVPTGKDGQGWVSRFGIG